MHCTLLRTLWCTLPCRSPCTLPCAFPCTLPEHCRVLSANLQKLFHNPQTSGGDCKYMILFNIRIIVLVIHHFCIMPVSGKTEGKELPTEVT